jgi:hypothetical protein
MNTPDIQELKKVLEVTKKELNVALEKSSLLVLEERTRLSDIIVKAKEYESDIVALSSNTDKFREIKNIEENDTFTKEMAILSL